MMNLKTLLDDPEFVKAVPCANVDYKALDVIMHEDDEGQDVFLILNGEVQVSTNIDAQNNPLSPGLARLSENDIFGELSMFDGEPRSAEVIALTDCSLVKFDGPSMIRYLDLHPDKGYFILREIFMHLVMHMRQNNIRTRTVLQLYLNENRT
ncbi:MAG: Crp/Fnr family transcriptional regulator [Gammaproteobacteria bacterium]